MNSLLLLLTFMTLMVFGRDILYYFKLTKLYAKYYFKLLFTRKPKPNMKEVSLYEFGKPIEYLRKLHPNLNDAQILSAREEEWRGMLGNVTRIQFGEKQDVDKHFDVKVRFDDKKDLITTTTPKSEFGKKFLTMVGNELIRKHPTHFVEEEND